jgi:hypothetical protein
MLGAAIYTIEESEEAPSEILLKNLNLRMFILGMWRTNQNLTTDWL